MGTVIRYVLVLIEAVVSLMLIGVILMQRSKSQGLGMALGGQMGEALFGARMGNVLTRVTVILAIIFLVNTTLLAYLGATSRKVSVTDRAVPAVPAAPAVPVSPAGDQGPLDMPLDAAPVDMGGSEPITLDANGASAPVAPAPVANEPVAENPVAAEPVPEQ